jgi:hypothetical protein
MIECLSIESVLLSLRYAKQAELYAEDLTAIFQDALHRWALITISQQNTVRDTYLRRLVTALSFHEQMDHYAGLRFHDAGITNTVTPAPDVNKFLVFCHTLLCKFLSTTPGPNAPPFVVDFPQRVLFSKQLLSASNPTESTLP